MTDIHDLGLLQEAAPDELAAERPFHLDQQTLALYKCVVLRTSKPHQVNPERIMRRMR